MYAIAESEAYLRGLQSAKIHKTQRAINMLGTLDIKYTAKKTLRLSAWAFDPPFLLEGETATVIGYYTGGENPLYVVRRDRDGVESPAHRRILQEAGEFDQS
jgi:hypothetical protein